MYDQDGNILYVGKALNLKKRVSSYFQRQLDTKTQSLVQQIDRIEVTVTRNAREALLLESNLIKEYKPRYNIIFRDDKSYPFLYLANNEAFPALRFYRGSKKEPGKYYGPYPSAGQARDALNHLQRIFKLRNCDNSFFKNRDRPCLQYQIQRCTAPCVGYITETDYKIQVDHLRLFLEGKSQDLIFHLIQEMEQASESLAFEKAASIREEISLLRKIQEKQIIVGKDESVDVLGIAIEHAWACVQVLIIRDGRMLGTRPYFPNQTGLLSNGDASQNVLEHFISQHYFNQPKEVLPQEIIIAEKIHSQEILEEALSSYAGRKIAIRVAKRGVLQQWLNMANENASETLNHKLERKSTLFPGLESLQDALELQAIPERIECFDVSHTLGEATVASCVVCDESGLRKDMYRRFNIRGVKEGDDYAALKQAITRRYGRLKIEGQALPDVLLIDGGLGQLSVALDVLRELQVNGVVVLAMAKGVERKSGLEKVYRSKSSEIVPGSSGMKVESEEIRDESLHVVESTDMRDESASMFELSPIAPDANGKNVLLTLDPQSTAFKILQQIRDEAHRFAISTHRKQRRKNRMQSVLEEIPGVGKMRRLALLRFFGGLQEIRQASVEEIAKVPGLNKALALRIFQSLHK